MPIQGAAFAYLTPSPLNGTITISGFPFRPKPILHAYSGRGGTVNASGRANHRRGFGFSIDDVGFPSYGIAAQSQDAQNPTNCDGGLRDDAPVSAISTAGAYDGICALDAVNADGFRMKSLQAFASQIEVSHLALGDTSIISFKVGTFNEPAAAGTPTLVNTGQNLAANGGAIFILGEPSSGAIPTLVGDVRQSFGFGTVIKGIVKQAVWAGGSNNGVSPAQTLGYCRRGEIAAYFDTAVTGLNSRMALDSYASNGFNFFMNEILSTTRRYQYLSIEGGIWDIVFFLTALNTNPYNLTGLFQNPKAAVILSGNAPEDAADTPHDHDKCSIGFWDSLTNQEAAQVQARDGGATSVISTVLRRDRIYANCDSGGTLTALLNADSTLSDGIRVSQNVADDAANFGAALFCADNLKIPSLIPAM